MNEFSSTSASCNIGEFNAWFDSLFYCQFFKFLPTFPFSFRKSSVQLTQYIISFAVSVLVYFEQTRQSIS